MFYLHFGFCSARIPCTYPPVNTALQSTGLTAFDLPPPPKLCARSPGTREGPCRLRVVPENTRSDSTAFPLIGQKTPCTDRSSNCGFLERNSTRFRDGMARKPGTKRGVKEPKQMCLTRRNFVLECFYKVNTF